MATLIWDYDMHPLVKTDDGYSYRRTGRVIDLPTAWGPHDKQFYCLKRSDVPDIGDKSPIDSDLKVVKCTATLRTDSRSVCDIVIDYAIPTDPEPSTEVKDAIPEFGGSLTNVVTAFDIDGHQLYTEHEKDNKSPGTAQKLEPLRTKRFRRREPGRDPNWNIEENAQLYLGTVNRSGSIRNYSKREWLCTMLHATTPDNGDSYWVDYEFQYRAPQLVPMTATSKEIPGWDAVIAELDPMTGNPKEGILWNGQYNGGGKAPKGITVWQMFEESRMDRLNLWD